MQLVGRQAERARLAKLVDSVRAGEGASLVLRGEAGIGKSALLDWSVEQATDLHVVRVWGTESELDLGFAALHQLLQPFLSGVDHLPAPQGNALRTVFGLTSGAPPDRFVIALGALTLLTNASREQPILCVVDDAQWIDRSSLEAIAFVGRRVEVDGVGVLFGVRDLDRRSNVLHGLPEHRVGGLADDEARELLSQSAPGSIDPAVATRVIAEAQGSPLAIAELANALTASHLAGHVLLPLRLPTGAKLEAHFQHRVGGLPPDAQTLLLLGAAETDGDADHLRRARAWLGLSAESDAAIDDGFLVIDTSVRFRHPLIRSVVYGRANALERRRVHDALAATTESKDRVRWAWHAAAAASEPTEEIALELESAAHRARARGGHTSEATFLRLAAELSPNQHDRARRLLDAAQAAHSAGATRHAAALLSEARALADTALLSARAERLQASLVSFTVPGNVPLLLLEVARTLEELDIRLARETYAEALLAAHISAQLTLGTSPLEVAQAALAAAPSGDAESAVVDALVEGFATRVAVGFCEAVPFFRAAIDAFAAGAMTSAVSRWAVLAINAAEELWDAPSYQQLLDRLEQSERERGALDSLRLTLCARGTWEMWGGRFSSAETAFDEASAIGGLFDGGATFWHMLKVELMAWQGAEKTRATISRMTGESAQAFRVGSVVNTARSALVVLELSEGNYREALDTAWLLYEDDMSSNQILPDIVEAGVRCGDSDAAQAALARLSERVAASPTPWALGLLARSRALMADDNGADELYRRAIAHLEDTPIVIDIARTHLVYGEWLRRQKRKLDARRELRTAYELFDRMGAAAFAVRARAELAATGQQARKRSSETMNDLTPQELQVARLAAQGATYAEVAARMFISSSTVDYHLRKVYRKLAITSRRQLARVFK